MTFEETAKIVTVLKAIYPAWRPEAETVKVWYEMLTDLPYQAVDVAIRRLTMTRANQWPPSIGEIREDCASMKNPALEETAEEAWGTVLRAVRQRGYMKIPIFKSPITQQAVDALGWREICMSQAGDTGVRAHFFRTYTAYQVRAKAATNLPENLQIKSHGERISIDAPPTEKE